MAIRSKRSRQHEIDDLFHGLVGMMPDPWSAEDFVARIARSRGRDIRLLTAPLTTSDPTGFWLSTRIADYIVVAENASGARRDAIIGHELAHIVLGHSPQTTADADGLADLAPSTSPELVVRYLPRHGYEVAIEHEAETLATRLIAYVQARPAATTATELGRLSNRLR